MNNSIGMDYLQEAIILGIDALIFGLCLKSYHNHKNTIQALKVNFIFAAVLKCDEIQLVLFFRLLRN